MPYDGRKRFALPGEDFAATRRRIKFRDSAGDDIHVHLHVPGEPPKHRGSSLDERVREHINKREAMAQRMKKRAADEEGEKGYGGERVVGRLPEPPNGMVYRVQEDSNGEWSVVLSDDDGSDVLTGNSTVDRTMRHSLRSGSRLAAMNKFNRAYYSREKRTADREQTLYRHLVLPGERIRLEGPDERGGYSVVLVSSDDPNFEGRTPLGADGSGRTITSGSSKPSATGDSGYRAGSAAHLLRQQNIRNREFWKRK